MVSVNLFGARVVGQPLDHALYSINATATNASTVLRAATLIPPRSVSHVMSTGVVRKTFSPPIPQQTDFECFVSSVRSAFFVFFEPGDQGRQRLQNYAKVQMASRVAEATFDLYSQKVSQQIRPVPHFLDAFFVANLSSTTTVHLISFGTSVTRSEAEAWLQAYKRKVQARSEINQIDSVVITVKPSEIIIRRQNLL